MHPRILLAGFEPFAGRADNPSERVVRALEEASTLTTLVLPVAYDAASGALTQALERLRPAAVLLVGAHTDAADPRLRLERFALNLDDAPLRDNHGEQRLGSAVVVDGPAAYPSTLPLDAFAAQLELQEVSYRWSRDAGGFLCNHAFYLARHATEGRGIPCGLLHLPEKGDLEALERALRSCLDVLTRAVQGEPRVQFAHGLEGSPRGSKARLLAEHFVAATPAMDTGDFSSCVSLHRAAIERFRPRVLVGSSFGAAVAVELLQQGAYRGPTLLLAQAALRLLPHARLPRGVPVCLVHGLRDELIDLEETRALASTGDASDIRLIEVDDDHSLRRSTEDGTLLELIRSLAAH